MAELFSQHNPMDLLERESPIALQLELDVIPSKVHTEAALTGLIDFYNQRPAGLIFTDGLFATGRWHC